MEIREPLFFKPILLPRIWGGSRLGSAIEGVPVGESWLFSPLAGEETVVEQGPFQGESVTSLAERFGASLVGSHVYANYGATFPLLVKILDTASTLSVQLHPDEATARRAGLACGKREAWYVLPEGDGANMLLGLREALTRGELAEAVAAHRIGELLNRVRAEAGCCYEVPAGTIHALDAGNFVLELQQPSDTTYRLYDWGRVDAQGKGRPLHVEESLACATLTPYRMGERAGCKSGGAAWTQLVAPPFFAASRAALPCGGCVEVRAEGEAILLVLTEGAAELRSAVGQRWLLPLHRAVLLPAQFGAGSIVSSAGGVVVASRAQ